MEQFEEPAMPASGADGNDLAKEAIQVSIARTVLRDRRVLDWSQEELARRACVRVATLGRIESGKHPPNLAPLDKIERALKAGRAKRKGKEP